MTEAQNIRWASDGSDEAVADFLADCLQGEGQKHIAVPGGRTPGPIFKALAQRLPDLSAVTISLTDDRIVPVDHPASNLGLAERSLAGTQAHVLALAEGQQFGRFECVWLGVGEDGHIASLFPNIDPQIDAKEMVVRLTPDPLPLEAPFDRLSLTIPALINCDQMIFVIRGAAKRKVIEDAIAGTDDLPVTRLLQCRHQPRDYILGVGLG